MNIKKFLFGNNTYGFINGKHLPNISLDEKTIVNNNLKFVTTNDFKDCAKNHCAATLMMNLSIYYANLGFDKLINKDIRNTFNNIHEYIGDGPIFFLESKAKRYIKKCGYILITNKLANIEEIKQCIDDGIPCAMLLMDALFNWHWVLAVGYKDNYLQIIDNWHKDVNRYYKLNEGSRFVFAFSMSIKNK